MWYVSTVQICSCPLLLCNGGREWALKIKCSKSHLTVFFLPSVFQKPRNWTIVKKTTVPETKKHFLRSAEMVLIKGPEKRESNYSEWRLFHVGWSWLVQLWLQLCDTPEHQPCFWNMQEWTSSKLQTIQLSQHTLGTSCIKATAHRWNGKAKCTQAQPGHWNELQN